MQSQNWMIRVCLFLWVGMASILPAAGQTPSIAPTPAAQSSIPDEFRDPDTGLRIVHVSRVPNDRSGVIYFTQNSWTADSHRVLFHVQLPDKWRHLYTFDLQTQDVVPIVTDRWTANQDFSPHTGNIYYQADHAVWVVNIDARQPRKLADLPLDWSTGAGVTFNADETLVAGSTEEGSPDPDPNTEAAAATTAPSKVAPETKRLKAMGSTFAAHKPNLLYVVNVKTGNLQVIYRINTWLGHVQFSPTDPSLLMFCHEGPWEKVDRIWTMRVMQGPGAKPDAKLVTTAPVCFFNRSEPNEIAGHEFWSFDGKTIWFQHTFKTEKKNYLTGKGVLDGKITQFTLSPRAASIHQAISPDGKFFVGDGAAGKGNAAGNKYLSLLTPKGDTLAVTELCSLQKNDYTQCEPNPHISPDNHWVLFTATFFGNPQAWALELPKSLWR